MFARLLLTAFCTALVSVPRLDVTPPAPPQAVMAVFVPDRLDVAKPATMVLGLPDRIVEAFPVTVAPAPAVEPVQVVATPTPAEIAVQVALEQVGKPYRWGSKGPDSFDCSGLTSFAWAAAGVEMQAYTVTQWWSFPRVPLEEIQPGDLVFSTSLGHVYIYVGDGMVVHAPGTGMKIRESTLPVSGIRKEVVRPSLTGSTESG